MLDYTCDIYDNSHSSYESPVQNSINEMIGMDCVNGISIIVASLKHIWKHHLGLRSVAKDSIIQIFQMMDIHDLLKD